MSLPYMEFYVDDYEAATAHLTLEEDGIYNRLLRICWRTPGCSMPADPKWVCRMMRSNQWDKIETVLDEFFTLKRGRYHQKKQMKIFVKANQRHERLSEAGKRGAEAKSLKIKEMTSSEAISQNKGGSSQAQATRTITITNKKKSKKESYLPENFPDSENKKKAVGYWKQNGFEMNVEREVLKFRAHHTDKETVAKSWPCRWTTWYVNALDYGKPKPVSSAEPPDYNNPEWWRKRFGDPDGPHWQEKWKAYYFNNWPSGNFPEDCPKEIISEYYPEEIAA